MLHPFFKINVVLQKLGDEALDSCNDTFKKIDEIAAYNQQKVLSAFIKNNICESHFNTSTGYGYADRGREALDRVVADTFGAQDALIRHSFASGTHTLCVSLFGLLRPGDKMLCVTGTPYDTICPVIGIRGGGSQGSLRDFGVEYLQCELNNEGRLDYKEIESAIIKHKPRMVYIQRSRGYTLRKSLSVEEIAEVSRIAKKNSDAIVMVDNCYGEFAEKKEPVEAGADIMAGSLIKNPGGGIARSGGYIAGRADLVELCSYRMTTPGVGREVGATLGNNREMFMGFFSAPHVTGEAMKTAVFTAALFEKMGYEVTPKPFEERNDIIESIILKNREKLIAFCKGLQKGSPVDSFVSPEPWAMPGYDSEVIMAAGAFTLGSSIELSADAPLQEPFAVWLQGGLNFHSAQIGVLLAADEILKEG